MLLLGVLFLTATVLAQPTVYIARSSVAYPSYRMYLDGTVPEIAIIKEPETRVEPEIKVIPEAPVLEPLPIDKSVELEAEDPKDDTDEIKDEQVLENKSEEERREEVLKEEAPKREESEEDKKVVVKLEDPKPPKFFSTFISALPIKLPSFELPFNLGSLWKPKGKEIRLVPAYDLREWTTLIADK